MFLHDEPFGRVHKKVKVMSKKIYVGNLSFNSTEDEIRNLFSQYGAVASVSLITDRETGSPRGFGFVEMDNGADEAIKALDNHELGGRSLKVNEAKPRESRGRSDGARF